MRSNVSILYRKEVSSFFNSPVAYITLIGFLIINAWFFTSSFFLINESDLRTLFSLIPIIYLFFIPAITMGLITRELNSDTMEFLTTMPVSDSEIIIGKFLAALTLIGTALLFTLVHFLSLLIVGNNIDIGAIISGYLGLLIVGAAYAAIGTFSSTITKNQIVAFIVCFVIMFILFILDKILIFVPGFLSSIFQYLSIDYHLSNISRGVIDSRNIIYLGSIITFFLLLSIRTLEMRRWR
ncbi:MAG: ABC transporter [Candidatus Neomarinimicrobiota bacterium]|nr:MAG: ABC transporter [Candidatus Neomarinimicrobiota bacterium]